MHLLGAVVGFLSWTCIVVWLIWSTIRARRPPYSLASQRLRERRPKSDPGFDWGGCGIAFLLVVLALIWR
jgi:hypothetical protein